MWILKLLISFTKILLITFLFTLIIDFFFGKKILEKFDNFFSKSQFYERLIRIDHPIYHHTLRDNVKYSNKWSYSSSSQNLCNT